MTDAPAVHDALATLLRELADGAPAEGCWVLNPGDAGLLRSLDRLSAAAASAAAPGGGPSIAAHVDHLCYGLSLMNRWADGEPNPFATADYAASWRRGRVSDEEWAALRADLAERVHRWLDVVGRARPLKPAELTGMLASVVHLAYHLGAVRQVDRSTRGPAARD